MTALSSMWRALAIWCFVRARTLGAFGRAGDPVSVSVETHVREDHIHLYGFADQSERDWFKLLTTVQGVGAKVALAILGTLAPDELANAMMAEDKAALTGRRALALAWQFGCWPSFVKKRRSSVLCVMLILAANRPRRPGAVADAVSALVNLGYGRSAAFGAVSQAAQALGDESSVEALVKAGLQELSA